MEDPILDNKLIEKLHELPTLQELKLKEMKELDERLKGLDRFPGSLEDYCTLKGKRFEMIDTGRPTKFILDYAYHYEEVPIWKQLLEQGCVGLIWYNNPAIHDQGDEDARYGVPVRRKE